MLLMEALARDDLRGHRVLGWRISEEGLFLRLESQAERQLCCECTRSHWILHSETIKGRAVLTLKCHCCGSEMSLLTDVFSEN